MGKAVEESVESLLELLRRHDAMLSEDLVARLVRLRRTVASIEVECTALIAEMIRRDAHGDLGYRSMVSLLVDRLCVAAGVARGMIRVATALSAMPHTLTALASGAMDLSRVRLLVSAREVAPELFADHEQVLVDSIGGRGGDA